MIRIRDNGHGIGGPVRPDGPIRLGVGVTGMQARLEQFGGGLKIRTGRGGTCVVAMIPISRTGRAPQPAGRLRMMWQSDSTEADSEISS